MSMPLVLVFMNNYAEEISDHYLIRDYIDEQLRSDQAIIFCNSFLDIPKELVDYLTDDFFYGLAFAQITEMKRGGIFINPALPALSNDYELWSNIILSEVSEVRTIKALDIPYKLYVDCVETEDMVAQDTYDENTQSMQELANVLNKIRPMDVILH